MTLGFFVLWLALSTAGISTPELLIMRWRPQRLTGLVTQGLLFAVVLLGGLFLALLVLAHNCKS